MTCEATTPRISYIISTRNRAQYLDAALQNVRQFLTPQDELIIIDGASTDETREVAKKHSDIIDVFESGPDVGEAHGDNKGILRSRGEIIKLLTDDDYFYPEAMKQAVSVMESHPEIEALQCGGVMYKVDPATGEERFYTTFRKRPHDSSPPYVTMGLFMRRSLVARVGLLDTNSRFVDLEYHPRILQSGATFRYLNVKLYRHTLRLHSGRYRFPERVLVEEVRFNLISEAATPGGKSLLTLVQLALHVHQRALGRLIIRILAFVLPMPWRVWAVFKRAWGRIKPLEDQPSEAVWDGTLS
jgi:glycosyltransferase involved in cell wall biosynthesis